MVLLFDPTQGFKQAVIPHTERVHGKFKISILKYGVNATGGELIVTDNYLVLNPMNSDAAQLILKTLLGAAGGPVAGAANPWIDAFAVTDPIVIPKQTILAIGPLKGGFLRARGGLRITLTNGRSFDLAILHTYWATILDPRHDRARDAAFGVLKASGYPY